MGNNGEQEKPERKEGELSEIGRSNMEGEENKMENGRISEKRGSGGEKGVN